MAGNVLIELARRGISMTFLAARGLDRIAIVTGKPHNHARLRIAQYRAYTAEAFRLQFARCLVAAKIIAQTKAMSALKANRPDLAFPIGACLESLLALKDQLPYALSIQVMMGIEGAASHAYFEALTQAFPPSIGFTGRNRRPPRDPANACLSLGYTLLAAETTRAAYGIGLDPFIGFFHELAYGRESLSLDLMEPLRPRVDLFVWGLFRDRMLRKEHFHDDKGACLLGKTGRQAFFRTFEVFMRPVRRYLRTRTWQVSKTLLSSETLPKEAEA